MKNYTIAVTETTVRLLQLRAETDDQALVRAEECYNKELCEEMQMDAPVVDFIILGAVHKPKPGRPSTKSDDIPDIFRQYLPNYLSGEWPLTRLAKACNLSRPTIYKYLKLIKEKEA